MKKKILSLLTMLCMVVALLPTNIITVSAYTETKYGDYLYYTESNGEIEISDCDSSAMVISIPSEIDGKKVTKIGNYAFFGCKSLTSITIPGNVTNIDIYAFFGCESLTSITIPDSVTNIGNRAFSNCSSLTSITISDSVTNIGSSAFSNCSSLTSVTIPDSVTSLDYAFSDCSSLTSVTIPDSVTCIDGAFSDCTGLTSITIPDSVTNIGNRAFSNCSSLTSITIPDSVTSIGNGAFSDCSSLTNITIPDSVTSISYYAFGNCTGLTNITIPDSVTSIDGAFFGCTGLTSITIPDSVTSIDGTFSGCTGLTSITIPDSVTNIGNHAFNYCRSLTSITIPDSVTSIGSEAFYGCTGLTNITIPDSVTSIGYGAFSDCTNLTTVVIPKTITEINPQAFNCCDNLSLIFYTGSSEEWDEMYIVLGNDAVSNATKIYNAAKKTYKLETNCDTALSYITDYAIMTAPAVTNGEKVFQGWYDNKSLTGSPVTFPYYGNAATLYASWTETGASFDEAFTAKANEEYSVTIAESGQKIYYQFTPKKTGEYRFYSMGDLDTYGYLYDSGKSQIASSDDGGEGNNFKIIYNLTAGKTYYIAIKLNSGTGSFTLVTETDCVEGTKTTCVTTTTGEKIFFVSPKNLPENAAIILVCYKNNALQEVLTTPNKNETPYFIPKKEFDSVKVMVWNSFSDMTPLCEPEIVE